MAKLIYVANVSLDGYIEDAVGPRHEDVRRQRLHRRRADPRRTQGEPRWP